MRLVDIDTLYNIVDELNKTKTGNRDYFTTYYSCRYECNSVLNYKPCKKQLKTLKKNCKFVNIYTYDNFNAAFEQFNKNRYLHIVCKNNKFYVYKTSLIENKIFIDFNKDTNTYSLSRVYSNTKFKSRMK